MVFRVWNVWGELYGRGALRSGDYKTSLGSIPTWASTLGLAVMECDITSTAWHQHTVRGWKGP